MNVTYVAPSIEVTAFTCPHCGVYAKQDRRSAGKYVGSTGLSLSTLFPIRTAICQHCDDYSIWNLDEMVYPSRGSAPLPNAAMPEDPRRDYEEAARIAQASPRGAAALLRLAIQKLCIELGEKGKNINHDIGELVKKGLPIRVQQALDVVRVTGNHAVHPGQIDLDDGGVVGQLFGLINIIVEYMIALPEQVEGSFQALPERDRENIAKRDGTTAPKPLT